MIEALVFDFDGLILETEQLDFQVWKELYKSYNVELSLNDFSRCIGAGRDHFFNPHSDLETKLGHPVNWDEENPKRSKRVYELVLQQPVLPGVKTYLEDAKKLGIRVGLASSSPHDWVDGHLTRLGLIEYFETIKCADDVQETKPDPSLYLEALRVLNTQPQKAIALEDSQNGVTAAKNAGMLCVAVPTAVTRHMNLAHADYCLNSLAELPLEKLIKILEKQ